MTPRRSQLVLLLGMALLVGQCLLSWHPYEHGPGVDADCEICQHARILDDPICDAEPVGQPAAWPPLPEARAARECPQSSAFTTRARAPPRHST